MRSTRSSVTSWIGAHGVCSGRYSYLRCKGVAFCFPSLVSEAVYSTAFNVSAASFGEAVGGRTQGHVDATAIMVEGDVDRQREAVVVHRAFHDVGSCGVKGLWVRVLVLLSNGLLGLMARCALS